MKGITKKILSLALTASLVIGSSFGLAGCVDDPKKTASGDCYDSTTNLSNAYIVVSENGIETLHKGDLIETSWSHGSFVASMTPVLKFNCGKELQTTQFVAYPQGRPDESKYDEVCDCANE